MSSYPTIIVFGKVNKTGYLKGKYLKFEIFQYYKLYLAIVNILTFLTSSVEVSDRGLIHQSDEENYFWIGHKLLINNKDRKIVKIGIEKNDQITYEIVFSIKQLQFFFIALKNVILSSLCLKDTENNFFKFLLSKSPETYKKDEDLSNYIEEFIHVQNLKTVTEHQKYLLHNVSCYYKEIIIIAFKLESLRQPNFRHNILEQLI
jgi:hypothetical protein